MNTTAVKPPTAHDDALIPVALVEAALTDAWREHDLDHLAQYGTWEHPDGSPVTLACEFLPEPEAHKATHSAVRRDYPPSKGLRLSDLTSALPVPDQNGLAPKTAVADAILHVMCARSSHFVLAKITDVIEQHELAHAALHPPQDTTAPGWLPRCAWCGQPCNDVRARYCRPSHRQAAYKSRKRQQG